MIATEKGMTVWSVVAGVMAVVCEGLLSAVVVSICGGLWVPPVQMEQNTVSHVSQKRSS